MNLVDKAVRALALRWLAGKVRDLRKDGSVVGKVLKLLDGWKLVIAFLLIVAARVWDAMHNGHTGDILGVVLSAFAWAPPEWTVHAAGEAAAYGLAIGAIIHKLIKAQRQIRAGATPTEVMSEMGYAKLALYNGTILVGESGPKLSAAGK